VLQSRHKLQGALQNHKCQDPCHGRPGPRPAVKAAPRARAPGRRGGGGARAARLRLDGEVAAAGVARVAVGERVAVAARRKEGDLGRQAGWRAAVELVARCHELACEVQVARLAGRGGADAVQVAQRQQACARARRLIRQVSDTSARLRREKVPAVHQRSVRAPSGWCTGGTDASMEAHQRQQACGATLCFRCSFVRCLDRAAHAAQAAGA